jgi:hypothetical protein
MLAASTNKLISIPAIFTRGTILIELADPVVIEWAVPLNTTSEAIARTNGPRPNIALKPSKIYSSNMIITHSLIFKITHIQSSNITKVLLRVVLKHSLCGLFHVPVIL